MITHLTRIIVQPVQQDSQHPALDPFDRLARLEMEADRAAAVLGAAMRSVNSAQYPELYARLKRATERAWVRAHRRHAAARAAWPWRSQQAA